ILQLPDGRRCPMSAYIEHNPNQNFKGDPKQPSMTRTVSNFGASLKQSGMQLANVLTGRVGYNLMRPYKSAPDFKLDKGELLPIKFNRPLDVSQSTYGPGQNPLAGGPMNSSSNPFGTPPGASVPGLSGPDPDSIMQNLHSPASQDPVYTPAPGSNG